MTKTMSNTVSVTTSGVTGNFYLNEVDYSVFTLKNDIVQAWEDFCSAKLNDVKFVFRTPGIFTITDSAYTINNTGSLFTYDSSSFTLDSSPYSTLDDLHIDISSKINKIVDAWKMFIKSKQVISQINKNSKISVY